MAVARSARHRFSKDVVDVVQLVLGHGVDGDAHAGATVQHRSRKRWRPELPNLRQVHLLQVELLEELRGRGFVLPPGAVGENVLVRGLDLLALPAGTVLRLGPQACVELTGLRNPCVQLDRYADGLMAAMLRQEADGALTRLAGVMSVVSAAGAVRAGDPVTAVPPDGELRPLAPV